MLGEFVLLVTFLMYKYWSRTYYDSQSTILCYVVIKANIFWLMFSLLCHHSHAHKFLHIRNQYYCPRQLVVDTLFQYSNLVLVWEYAYEHGFLPYSIEDDLTYGIRCGSMHHCSHIGPIYNAWQVQRPGCTIHFGYSPMWLGLWHCPWVKSCMTQLCDSSLLITVDISMLFTFLIHGSFVFFILYSTKHFYKCIILHIILHILFMITCYTSTYGPSSWLALTMTYASWLNYEHSLLTILIDCKEKKSSRTMDLNGNLIPELPIWENNLHLMRIVSPKDHSSKVIFHFITLIYNLIFQNLVMSTSVHIGLTKASILHFSNIPHASSVPYKH